MRLDHTSVVKCVKSKTQAKQRVTIEHATINVDIFIFMGHLTELRRASNKSLVMYTCTYNYFKEMTTAQVNPADKQT